MLNVGRIAPQRTGDEKTGNVSFTFNGAVYSRYAKTPYFHRGGGHTLHRDVWEFHFGRIPDGCQIHHKDHNPLNNDIDNLECLTPIQHSERHGGRKKVGESKPSRMIADLYERPEFKRRTRNGSHQALAETLGIHWKTVAQISNGNYCGRKTAAAIARLHSKTAPPKPPRLALTIDYTDDAQRRRHLTLTMEERRQALEDYASKKETKRNE